MDIVPADDLGIQKIAGQYLGNGERMKSDDVRKALKPYQPWRGLAIFYLSVHSRFP
jgi:3-methyladenine DNA glycosylase/8-oxoguanine DNA glycosylase